MDVVNETIGKTGGCCAKRQHMTMIGMACHLYGACYKRFAQNAICSYDDAIKVSHIPFREFGREGRRE